MLNFSIDRFIEIIGPINRPPNPECRECGGSGRARFDNYHNGGTYMASCDCYSYPDGETEERHELMELLEGFVETANRLKINNTKLKELLDSLFKKK